MEKLFQTSLVEFQGKWVLAALSCKAVNLGLKWISNTFYNFNAVSFAVNRCQKAPDILHCFGVLDAIGWSKISGSFSVESDKFQQ